MSLFTSSSKSFFWSFLAVLFLSAVSFVVGTEAIVRTKVIPNHNDYKYFSLFRNSRSPNAVFGDSHAAYSLTGLDSFVNLAYGGNNFQSISGKVRLYFSKRRPGKVILQAGPHHFSRNFLTWREDETEAFRKSLNGYPGYIPKMFQTIHRKELFHYWALFLKGDAFMPILAFVPDGARLSSDRYSEVPAILRETSAARILRILEPVPGFQESASAKGYVTTIDFLQSKGARVCLVTFPVASTLRKGMNQLQTFREARAFFRDLARQKRVRYVNLLNLDLPNELFADAHHLNAAGARAISNEVVDRCFA